MNQPTRRAELVRAAYAAGWALSGGPMTERIKAGALAAVTLADTHPDDATAIEATIEIGRLRGVWAKVFADREQIHTTYGPRIVDAYRQLTKATVDVPGGVAKFRRLAGLTEADDQQTKDRRRGAAVAASVGMVHGAVDTSAPEYRDTVNTVGDGVSGGESAGYAAGNLVTGGDAAPQTRSDADSRAVAASAVAAMVQGSTTDTANLLVRLADDGVSVDDMETAVADGLWGDGDRSSGIFADLTLGRAFGVGLLAAFLAVGLRQVNFVTAGGNVCKTCQDFESANPWSAWQAPQPAIHPHCRCILTPVDSPWGFLADLVT